MTVQPLNVNNTNFTANTFTVQTFLYHNVDYSTQAAVWGPDLRGRVNESMPIFNLWAPPANATAFACPLYNTLVVSESVIVNLRAGLLFAVVSSGGAPAGELRGQIETRNDIFFAPIEITTPHDNMTGNFTDTGVVGAALIRIFDIRTYQWFDKAWPAGVDVYILSSINSLQNFYGLSVLTNLIAITFGDLPSSNSNTNTIYLTGQTLVRREDLEKYTLPVFGPGSSNMQLYSQSFLNPANYTNSMLGPFIRLPFLAFNDDLRGNDVFVYTRI
jgi:hypothetical protein